VRAVSAPRGYTLVELLVALVVLAVGVLAVAGASTPLARRLGEGARVRRAAALIDERVERFRLDSCPAPASGTRVAELLDERWVVARDGRLATISDTVRIAGARAARRAGASAARWCAP